MYSFPNVILTPSGEWKLSYLDDDGQWKDSDNKVSIVSNISATSFTKSYDVLESIIPAPQYKYPNTTFAYDVAFTKGANNEKLFYEIIEIDTLEFYDYKDFSTSLAVGPFGTNYVYADTCKLISSVSARTDTIPFLCTVSSLVRYCINGLSICKSPMYVNKIRKFFLFNPENIFMKTLEATTQLSGFNQCLPIR